MSAPTAVEIQLPEGWIEVDPRAPDILGALRTEIRTPPGSEDVVAALLTPLAVRLARLAASGDVVLAGFWSDVIEIEDGNAPLVMTAQVSLALSPPVGGLEKLRDVLGGEGLTVEPIDLPAGAGVVVTGTTEVDDPAWDRPQPTHLRRYFVPVPGVSRAAALSFLTPNLDLAEHFDEIFDAVAATVRFA